MNTSPDASSDADGQDPKALLIELERRVTALENAGAEAEAGAPSTTTKTEADSPTGDAKAESGKETEAGEGDAAGRVDGDDVFWALNGLIQRSGPSGGVIYTGHITAPGATSPVSWQMGLPGEAFENLDFAAAAGSLAALGHPVRLSVLQAIHEGQTTVAELSNDDRFGTSGQIYHHIHALSASGWLEKSTRGQWRIPPQKIVPLLTLVLIGTQ